MTRANRGRAWEATLTVQHDRYLRDERALVFRCHPPVTIISEQRGGRFTGCFAGDGPPDFTGVLAGGRAVGFDAKSCAGPRFALSLIERHQARDLEAVDSRGGLAFIALRMGAESWALPWDTLGPLFWDWREGRVVRGGASLTAADCDHIGHRMPTIGDWLPCFTSETT